MLSGNRRDKQFSKLKSNRLVDEVVGEISCRSSRRRNPGGRGEKVGWDSLEKGNRKEKGERGKTKNKENRGGNAY